MPYEIVRQVYTIMFTQKDIDSATEYFGKNPSDTQLLKWHNKRISKKPETRIVNKKPKPKKISKEKLLKERKGKCLRTQPVRERLSQEQIEDILTSKSSAKVLAEKHGISAGSVFRMRHGKA